MLFTPEEFIQAIINGKTEHELNRTESMYVSPIELKKLISSRYGHTVESAINHLTTDYTDGFTICKCCGSFYKLGKGFSKHISDGCIICEGEAKHHKYWHNGNNERNYFSSPRTMAVAFDDGMHYCFDKIEKNKYKELVSKIKPAI